MAIKIIGVSYLEQHTGMQKTLGVPEDHVIVDKKDWEEVVLYMQQHPEVFTKVINNRSQIHYNDEQTSQESISS